MCLFGAALDTANLGVSALGYAVLHACVQASPHCRFTVFDHSPGIASQTHSVDGLSVEYERCGGYRTRRLYRPESLGNIRVSAWFGGGLNPGARRVRAAHAILDISGGDSFCDLYGEARLASVLAPKRLALELRKPLILLPQTYGPFQDEAAKAAARCICKGASMAWARDARSFEVLKDLLGDAFDPARHREGVDVAFALRAAKPDSEAIAPLTQWFASAEGPVAGINVSGLILNRPEKARTQYSLRADYGKVIVGFVRRLVEEGGCRVLLAPHVNAPRGSYESDIDACEMVLQALPEAVAARVRVCPVLHDPCAIKGIIGCCDWFCGTRMHSAIAALSSGVPTAAIAYSIKTQGVFESCGQGGHVADPRMLDTAEMLEALWTSWAAREEARQSLAQHLPAVKERARAQIQDILRMAGVSTLKDALAGERA